MSNNPLPGNTPVEIAVNNYLTKLAKQAVNAGGPFDSPRGAPITSSASPLSRYVPWRNGAQVTQASTNGIYQVGRTAFFGAVPVIGTGTQWYLFQNNMDADHFVVGDGGSYQSTVMNPSIMVPAMSYVVAPIAATSSLAIASQVVGYDFTTQRIYYANALAYNPAIPDWRQNGQLTITQLDGGGYPSCGRLLPSWARYYDTKDFQAAYGGPLTMANANTGQIFPAMDFRGASRIVVVTNTGVVNGTTEKVSLIAIDPFLDTASSAPVVGPTTQVANTPTILEFDNAGAALFCVQVTLSTSTGNNTQAEMYAWGVV